MQRCARTRSCIDLKVCTFQKRFTSSCQWMALPTWNIARKHLLDTCRTGQNHYWRQDPGIQAMSAACEGRTRPSSRALHPAGPDDAWIGGWPKRRPSWQGQAGEGGPDIAAAAPGPPAADSVIHRRRGRATRPRSSPPAQAQQSRCRGAVKAKRNDHGHPKETVRRHEIEVVVVPK